MDFKVLIERIHEQNGYCGLTHDQYAFIPAYMFPDGLQNDFYDCLEQFEFPLYWRVNHHNDGDLELQFLNGSTGHESYCIKSLIEFGLMSDRNDFVYLCAGSAKYKCLAVRTIVLQALVTDLVKTLQLRS
ncbi:hypothetical protein [Chroococcidiopsis sp.]|uniref:hypothetical protein n=1 Tax=Chroococcidiopsis sp. TaxID=3088168 RepID=UPI003F676070